MSQLLISSIEQTLSMLGILAKWYTHLQCGRSLSIVAGTCMGFLTAGDVLKNKKISIYHAESVGIHPPAISSTDMVVWALTCQRTIEIICTTALPSRPFCALEQHIILESAVVTVSWLLLL